MTLSGGNRESLRPTAGECIPLLARVYSGATPWMCNSIFFMDWDWGQLTSLDFWRRPHGVSTLPRFIPRLVLSLARRGDKHPESLASKN